MRLEYRLMLLKVKWILFKLSTKKENTKKKQINIKTLHKSIIRSIKKTYQIKNYVRIKILHYINQLI